MASAKGQAWSDEELRRNVGQLFIVGFHGYTPSEDIKALITIHHVGAVILFTRNVSGATQLEELTKPLQDIAKSAGHAKPLFIGIDQEGGLVTRINPPIAAQMPGSMTLGATGSAENAFKVSSATAETLKSFGINMNYAPIADINSEPKNPVIGVRSPSDDPETVGGFVSASVRGLREGGVVPCVKHFPGHGDTAVDSHYGLPVINKTKADLEDCELIPFRRAAVEGIESIMTAHIALPALGGEEGLPASLNSRAIAILRDDLKYDGLLISDCLEMDGVRATFGVENGAVMALKAGTDCVMICHTMKAQVGAIEKVIKAVKSGEISQEALQKSVDRLTKLKERFLVKCPDKIEQSFNREAMNSMHSELSAEIYAKSATVVRSSPGSIPISKSPGKKIVFLSPAKMPLPSGEKTREEYIAADFVSVLRTHDQSIVDHRYYDEESIPPSILSAVENAETTILCTRNGSLSQFQKRMGLELGKKLGDKLIAIATCDPYDFLEDEVIKNYITIYEPTVPAFKAAIDIIFGSTKAQGRLPVQQVKPTPNIQPFDKDRDTMNISDLWSQVLPDWKVPVGTLPRLLGLPNAKNFVVYSESDSSLIAFSISYIGGGMAKLAVMATSPSHQNLGFGTALITHTRHAWSSSPGFRSFGIGSLTPRFWPGIPISLPYAITFFQHRGFHLSPNFPRGRDFFADIRHYQSSPRVENDIKTNGLTIEPLNKETYEEYAETQARTSQARGWNGAYRRLAEEGQYNQAMVAYIDGKQVGRTMMSEPDGVTAEDFAFLSLLGRKEGVDGNKIGVIAWVSVDEQYRGKGVGLALVSKAVEEMRKRGMEGVLIEWVYLKGFYEKLGFEPVWEYVDMDW